MEAIVQPDHQAFIETQARQGATESIRRRAEILLRYDEGRSTREVAGLVGLSTSRTGYWRRAYLREGLAIFPEGEPGAAPNAEAASDGIAGIDRKTLKKIGRLSREVRDVLGQKMKRKYREIESSEAFAAFVDYADKQRKKLKKELKKKGLKKKQVKFLREQVVRLEAQLNKADKLLAKIEKGG